MANILPFKGLRYRSKDLIDIMAPPYDIIGIEEQDMLHRRSPYNIIRLEYGITRPDDDGKDNRYTRAAAKFQEWLHQGILFREDEKCFYLYEQSYSYSGNSYQRTGIVTALRAESFESKMVLPHEETMKKPKSDRLKLLKSCRANFSPIFGLFPDPDNKIRYTLDGVKSGEPIIDFIDESGQIHRIWTIKDPALQENLITFMCNRPVFIADGHHRYETALAYSRESDLNQNPGRAYILSVLVSLQDPGLIVLPTHRLLSDLTEEQVARLYRLAGENFTIIERGELKRLELPSFMEEIRNRGQEFPTLGLILPGKALILTLRENIADCNLDACILKNKLLLPLFRSDEKLLENHVTFTKMEEEALKKVTSGSAQASFLMNPTPMEEVTRRSLQGERMPQKSTYFYPKLPSGLIIHHLDLSHE